MTVNSSRPIPGLHSFRQSLASRDHSPEDLVEIGESLLAKRQIRGSRDCAEATALLFRTLIDRDDTKDAVQLLSYVQDIGDKLSAAQSAEPIVDNMVTRIKGLIVEEIERIRMQSNTSDVLNPKATDVVAQSTSCLDLLSATPAQKTAFHHGNDPHDQGRTNSTSNAKGPSGVPNEVADPIAEVVGGIDELLDELRQVDDQIAAYAPDFIGSHDNVLTNSTSRSMTKFLLRAASKRRISIFLVTSFSKGTENLNIARNTGTEKAGSDKAGKTILDAGVPITLIPETAVFALMPQISKVLLDVDTAFADGSSLAPAGTKTIAVAARCHNRPVIMLSGVYKMSPRSALTHQTLFLSGDPSRALDCDDRKSLSGILGLTSPLNDYLSPDVASLFVSNLGGHAPVSIRRVVDDHYRKDYDTYFPRAQMT